MKKLLFVGDAACPSGFARATHGILDEIMLEYDVTVLGINYRGDPHEYAYPIYAAAPGGDGFGVGRLIWMCDKVQPNVVVLQNDGWNIQPYVRMLKRFAEYKDIPIVVAVAVDGKNFDVDWLRDVNHVIFWTQFALNEARLAGYTGLATVISLGVDRSLYFKEDRVGARRQLTLPAFLDSAFLVGNINRNQPRKRWDLTVKYFAEWITTNKIDDAWLYLHTAPTGDVGFHVERLMKYYGVLDKLILHRPHMFYGVSDDEMRATYNAFDVAITTTQGEGFGLTALEAMACGVPVIAPDWSALGDWAKNAAFLVPCTSTAATIGITAASAVIGGVPDESAFIKALNELYTSQGAREVYSQWSFARASSPDMQWRTIGQQWSSVLAEVCAPREALV